MKGEVIVDVTVDEPGSTVMPCRSTGMNPACQNGSCEASTARILPRSTTIRAPVVAACPSPVEEPQVVQDIAGFKGYLQGITACRYDNNVQRT
jgi:hypothetical protein